MIWDKEIFFSRVIFLSAKCLQRKSNLEDPAVECESSEVWTKNGMGRGSRRTRMIRIRRGRRRRITKRRMRKRGMNTRNRRLCSKQVPLGQIGHQPVGLLVGSDSGKCTVVQYTALLSSTVQCNKVQCSAVQCNSEQWGTVQCSVCNADIALYCNELYLIAV